MGINLRSAIGCSVPDIPKQLSTNGYVRIDAPQFAISDNLMTGFEDIQRLARFLPVDRTCEGGFRHRRYGKLFSLSWNDDFEVGPSVWDEATRSFVVEYSQPSSLNPEDGGRRRFFPTFERRDYSNPFLLELIRFDLANSPFSEAELAEPIQVGLHLIKLVAHPKRPAVVSPNVVHRDGEHYTWAHLIERVDAGGGKNWITDPEWAGSRIEDVPEANIRAGFTLEYPLDSYAVKDDLVAHSVDAVRVRPGVEFATRTMLLIDFTPMRAILMMEPKKA